MRIIYLFFTGLFIALVACVNVLVGYTSVEGLLLGSWDEVTWEYEKVNHDGSMTDFEISDGQRNEICKSLIIHEAESWRFTDDYKMKLRLPDGSEEDIKWKVKGRGNILELEHENLGLEDYQIQTISDDSLVIHFSFDLQLRGIVKMTFTRNLEKTYAQEI